MTVARTALVNRAETLGIEESTGKEMRLLRWMCGVTKLDKIYKKLKNEGGNENW